MVFHPVDSSLIWIFDSHFGPFSTHAAPPLPLTFQDLHTPPPQHVEVAKFLSEMVSNPVGLSSHELSILSESVSTQIQGPFLKSAEKKRTFLPLGDGRVDHPKEIAGKVMLLIGARSDE